MSGYTFEYLGHAAFWWTTPTGKKIVIDPFDNDASRPSLRWFTSAMPMIEADYALVTHDHFDHRAVNRVSGATIVRGACDFTIDGLRVIGIRDEHVPGHGPPQMPNVVFIVEAGGVRCCHWGDNRFDPPSRVIEQLGRVDILMVPVDDLCHLLQFQEVDGIADALDPRVVIPMHYKQPPVSDERSPLGGLDEWLKQLSTDWLRVENPVELASQLLPTERHAWVMSPSVKG